MERWPIKILGVLAGCLLASPLMADEASPFTLTFQPDWFPNGQFAGFFVADSTGEYTRGDLDVAFERFEFGTDFLNKVATGGAIIGTAEAYILMNAMAEGKPLVPIGVVLQESPAGYIYLADDGKLTPQSLAGKRIGVHAYADELLPFFLRQAGFQEDAATPVRVQHKVEVLLKGTVDLHQGYAVDEMLQLRRLTDRPVDILLFAELGLPVVSMVLYTNVDFLESHPGEIDTFLKASRSGWRIAFADPDKAATLISTHFADDRVDDSLLSAQVRELERFVMPKDGTLLQLAEERWRESEAALLNVGMIDSPVSAKATPQEQ